MKLNDDDPKDPQRERDSKDNPLQRGGEGQPVQPRSPADLDADKGQDGDDNNDSSSGDDDAE